MEGYYVVRIRGVLYGHFSSSEDAAAFLKKKGWYKPSRYEDVWHPLLGVLGDRSKAEIEYRWDEEIIAPHDV